MKSKDDQPAPVPLYAQIEDLLRERIVSGELTPGTPLPTERDLCEIFRVSRFTVRQALATLVREGLLQRHRRRGSFVARARIVEQPLEGFYTFAQVMADSGLPHRTVMLNRTAGVASPEEVEHLGGIRAGALVLRITRLRYLGNEPLLLETAHLPQALCPALTTASLEDVSLYQVLEARCGIAVTRAREAIRPALLEDPEASLLGLTAPAAVFRVERVAFAGEQPVEWRESLIRGDRFHYVVQLPRQLGAQVTRWPGWQAPPEGS